MYFDVLNQYIEQTAEMVMDSGSPSESTLCRETSTAPKMIPALLQVCRKFAGVFIQTNHNNPG